jgi:GTPase SAR1 family protein
MYHRDAQFAILVYAIDSVESFNEIEGWYRELKECEKMPQIVLVANKSDLGERRRVATEEGKELAKRIGALFFEVSAKMDAAGIQRMFEEIAIMVAADGGKVEGVTGKSIALSDGAGGCKC